MAQKFWRKSNNEETQFPKHKKNHGHSDSSQELRNAILEVTMISNARTGNIHWSWCV